MAAGRSRFVPETGEEIYSIESEREYTPTRPHCGYGIGTVTAFVDKMGVGEEAHVIKGETLSACFVCPERDAVLGPPNVSADF
jgi:hypothetical protein